MGDGTTTIFYHFQNQQHQRKQMIEQIKNINRLVSPANKGSRTGLNEDSVPEKPWYRFGLDGDGRCGRWKM